MAALALAGLLVGKGESDAGHAAIEETVNTAMTSTDPAICEQVFTDRWLEQNFGSSTQSPLERCREATTESSQRKADSVSVSDVSVEGDTALATAEASGGNVGGATIELRLVDADGWRLDELDDIAVDRDLYLAAQRAAIEEQEHPADVEALLTCMVDYAEANVSAAAIDRALVAGNESFYSGAYGDCDREFRSFFFSPAIIGAKTSYSDEQLRCISRTASEMVSDSELRPLYLAFTRNETPPSEVGAKTDAAVASCI